MACAQRAVERIAEMAKHGAWLAVFPKTFIPGDPLYHDYTVPDSDHFVALEHRFAEQAITIPGPETRCIADACRAYHRMSSCHTVFWSSTTNEKVAQRLTGHFDMEYVHRFDV